MQSGLLEGAALYAVLCTIFKIKSAGEEDEEDYFGTFDQTQTVHRGIVPFGGDKSDTTIAENEL